MRTDSRGHTAGPDGPAHQGDKAEKAHREEPQRHPQQDEPHRVEAKIWRLSNYYKENGQLPSDWKYDPVKVALLIKS